MASPPKPWEQQGSVSAGSVPISSTTTTTSPITGTSENMMSQPSPIGLTTTANIANSPYGTSSVYGGSCRCR